ncbi:MAG: CDP-alcohol phosphatidyltransferase family protein [Chloroflexota bacterium]
MANIITLVRFPLLFVYVIGLFFGSPAVTLWCVLFIILIILMDMVDGIIARARSEVSLLGSALDIATDRTLEIILWVVFAYLGLIPIIIPIIIITRGTTVDALRAVGMSSGLPPFDQLRSPLSRFLVASKFMRSTYGIVKAIAFAMLTLALGLQRSFSPWADLTLTIAVLFTWLAVVYSLARGLPVIVEGYSLLKNPPSIRK